MSKLVIDPRSSGDARPLVEKTNKSLGYFPSSGECGIAVVG
jgi:hypothetical protein